MQKAFQKYKRVKKMRATFYKRLSNSNKKVMPNEKN